MTKFDHQSFGWSPQAGPQDDLLTCPLQEIFFGGARGGGKSLCHGEPVLTPWGEKPIEECIEGDQVLNPDGTTAKIIAVYPQPMQTAYRVAVDDGAFVDVTQDHLWLARLTSRHLKASRLYLHDGESTNWKIWTTDDLRKKIDVGIRLPLTMPVSGQASSKYEVETDPYVIGLMLGDGCLVGSLRFTSADEEIQAVAQAVGFNQSGRPIEFFARRDTTLASDLKRLGLMGKRSWEKFVPHRYKHAVVQIRLSIVQGLLDTDGYADERGHIEYCSTSRQLADDVQEIVRSLGGKATLSEKISKENRPAYRVHIRHANPEQFFRLERKKARCRGKEWNGGFEHTRKIVSIEEIGQKQATCIKVDHPNGLFLTRGHIVTHNTDGVLGKWAAKERLYKQHFNAIMFRRTAVSAEDAIERSREIYRPLGGRFNESKLRWRMPNGGRVSFAYLDTVADANVYQGRNVTDAWVEEAGQYPSPAAIDRLFGILRSSHGVPIQLVLTANPGGPGQHWIRERYQIHPFPQIPKIMIRSLPNGKEHKVAVIPSRITDNKILLANDPGYVDRLQLVGSPQLVRAWLEGDWSAIEGAFFTEWDEQKHVLAPFAIPSSWMRFRSADWGSYSPFSIGWWAVATDDYSLADDPAAVFGAGSDMLGRNNLGTRLLGRAGGDQPKGLSKDSRIIPRGALVHYREWYGEVGGKLTAEEVANGIVEREKPDRPRLSYGVLDPSAFAESGGPSIAERINKVLIDAKMAAFRPADNKRVARTTGDPTKSGPMGGWDQMRARLKGDGVPMLYVFNICKNLIRTLPVMQHDDVRQEDLQSEGEDHAVDMARYACMSRPWMRKITKTLLPPRDSYHPAQEERSDGDSILLL